MPWKPSAQLLCLPPIPPSLDTSALPAVYKSVAQLAKKEVEPAGVAYQKRCRVAVGLAVDGEDEEDSDKLEKEQLEAEDAKLRAEWERR